MLSAIQAVNAVRAFKEVVMQEGEQWLYVAITDQVTCHHCLSKDQRVYSATDELDLLDVFPDLTRISANEIAPNVHMTLWGKDTCRCRLYRYGSSDNVPSRKPPEVRRGGYRTTSPEDIGLSNDELNRIVYEKPTQYPLEPAIKEPLESPEIVRKLPYLITDQQYMNFLDGLLAAGAISAGIYDLIVKRRKQQKKQQEK